MTELLNVQNVTVRFGGVLAVQNVSLTISRGDLLGFIGPNGAGKTTLVRVLTGIVTPQTGSVIFKGEDITSWPTHRRIHYGLALALGGVEVTMEELVRLYAMLANKGELKALRWRKGEDKDVKGIRLLSPETSHLVLEMLQKTPRPSRGG